MLVLQDIEPIVCGRRANTFIVTRTLGTFNDKTTQHGPNTVPTFLCVHIRHMGFVGVALGRSYVRCTVVSMSLQVAVDLCGVLLGPIFAIVRVIVGNYDKKNRRRVLAQDRTTTLLGRRHSQHIGWAGIVASPEIARHGLPSQDADQYTKVFMHAHFSFAWTTVLAVKSSNSSRGAAAEKVSLRIVLLPCSVVCGNDERLLGSCGV